MMWQTKNTLKQMLSLRLILIQNLTDQKNKSMNFCVITIWRGWKNTLKQMLSLKLSLMLNFNSFM